MQEKETKQKKASKIVSIIYLLISLLLAIPSIGYLAKYKTIYSFGNMFTYTLTKPQIMGDLYWNAILYLLLFSILFFCYFYLLKNWKHVFQTKKKCVCFILIVGILFSIMIPTTSLDVYSYIGNGWVDSHYKENPYYTPVQEIINEHGIEPILGKVAKCWINEPVIYGPVWSLICKALTSISFGNIDIALMIFKISSLIIFLGCSAIIYKITNKKFFSLLFALNPYILFEFLTNAHNDIFLIFFILLAIYFIKNKKNITLAVASLALATGIKYLSILLVPFLLIYALRKENTKTKIRRTILYAIEFIGLLGICYAFYIRDLRSASRNFCTTK